MNNILLFPRDSHGSKPANQEKVSSPVPLPDLGELKKPGALEETLAEDTNSFLHKPETVALNAKFKLALVLEFFGVAADKTESLANVIYEKFRSIKDSQRNVASLDQGEQEALNCSLDLRESGRSIEIGDLLTEYVVINGKSLRYADTRVIIRELWHCATKVSHESDLEQLAGALRISKKELELKRIRWDLMKKNNKRAESTDSAPTEESKAADEPAQVELPKSKKSSTPVLEQVLGAQNALLSALLPIAATPILETRIKTKLPMVKPAPGPKPAQPQPTKKTKRLPTALQRAFIEKYPEISAPKKLILKNTGDQKIQAPLLIPSADLKSTIKSIVSEAIKFCFELHQTTLENRDPEVLILAPMANFTENFRASVENTACYDLGVKIVEPSLPRDHRSKIQTGDYIKLGRAIFEYAYQLHIEGEEAELKKTQIAETLAQMKNRPENS